MYICVYINLLIFITIDFDAEPDGIRCVVYIYIAIEGLI